MNGEDINGRITVVCQHSKQIKHINQMAKRQIKFRSLVELFEFLLRNEVTDGCFTPDNDRNFKRVRKGKLSYNVPFFYGNKSICLYFGICSIKRCKSGIVRFWYGNLLKDEDQYLEHERTNRFSTRFVNR